jgi:hypothetical protein
MNQKGDCEFQSSLNGLRRDAAHIVLELDNPLHVGGSIRKQRQRGNQYSIQSP